MGRLFVITAFASVIAAVGAAAVWFYSQSTTVTVSATLGEEGPDITDQINWRVFKTLESGGTEGVSLSIVETYEAQEGDPFTFVVEPGVPIAVTGRIGGDFDLERVITPDARQQAEVVFTPEGGLIVASARAGNVDNVRLTLERPRSGVFTRTFNYFDPKSTQALLLQPGEYALSVDDEIVRDRKTVSVEEGEIADVTFDVRRRDVTLRLESAAPFPDSLPRPIFRLDRIDMNGRPYQGFVPDGAVETVIENVPYGPVTAEMWFRDDFGLANLEIGGEQAVEISDETDTITFRAETARVDMTLAGLPDELPAEPYVTIVETTFKGAVVAGTPVADGSASLVFEPDARFEAPTEFSLALRVRNEFVAFAPIGRPSPGERIDVTLTNGEGLQLCAELYRPSRCVAYEAD